MPEIARRAEEEERLGPKLEPKEKAKMRMRKVVALLSKGAGEAKDPYLGAQLDSREIVIAAVSLDTGGEIACRLA